MRVWFALVTYAEETKQLRWLQYEIDPLPLRGEADFLDVLTVYGSTIAAASSGVAVVALLIILFIMV